jgi:hypothetical protein
MLRTPIYEQRNKQIQRMPVGAIFAIASRLSWSLGFD